MGKSRALVEQEPFILSGTVKENILFGQEFNRERLKKVIDICCLRSDLSQLELGLETVLGERGLTLSGGQKVRVAMARACYSEAEIYLLDDPLSAVDAKVAHSLFDICIRGYLKTRL
jgi:ABC-type multidrug transport system fused ATPase/permease subunit